MEGSKYGDIVEEREQKKNTNNYRPICLLSNMYKLLTKIITTRLEKKLDENQPRELAGVRSNYSTTDHIHGEVLRIQHTTVCCFRGLREGIRHSTNPSNIDIISRTRNIICVHRYPERHIYGQLSDSTSAQRE